MKEEQLAIIQTLDKLPLDEAKAKAKEIVMTFESKTLNQKTRNNRLEYDIDTARSSIEVSGFMWRCFMASEGNRVIDSAWHKHYG